MNKFLLLIFILTISTVSFSQSYKKKFKDKLEPNSKLIESGYNYTFEKVNDTLYVFKHYFPENKQITNYRSYADKKLNVKNGLFKKMYDDGTLVSRGYYINNEKEGIWLEGIDNNGLYKNGKKTGKWKSFYADSTVYTIKTYEDDKLHGDLISYDSLGNVALEEKYLQGELISSTIDTTQKNS